MDKWTEIRDVIKTVKILQSCEEIIERFDKLIMASKYVFRGCRYGSELLPLVMRNKETISREKNLLKDFEYYGSSYFSASNAIDFMACADHYGLPTRLLDFTHNPYIALFFALHTKKENGSYYILCADTCENIMLDNIDAPNTFDQLHGSNIGLSHQAIRLIDFVENYFNFDRHDNTKLKFFSKHSFNKENDKNFQKKVIQEKLLFVDPKKSNQRILMQQGLFMFPYCLDLDKYIELLNENIVAYEIPRGVRTKMINYMKGIGVDTIKLMPDLQSLCAELKNISAPDDEFNIL